MGPQSRRTGFDRSALRKAGGRSGPSQWRWPSPSPCRNAGRPCRNAGQQCRNAGQQCATPAARRYFLDYVNERSRRKSTRPRRSVGCHACCRREVAQKRTVQAGCPLGRCGRGHKPGVRGVTAAQWRLPPSVARTNCQPKRCSAFFVLLFYCFLVLRVLRHLGVAKPVEAAAGPTTVRDRTGCRLPVKRRDPVKSSRGKVMG